MNGFARLLDSFDRLSLEEQEQVAETLRRRIAERRRVQLEAAVRSAGREWAAGKLKPVEAGEVMRRVVK
jgi:hypothetical protein